MISLANPHPVSLILYKKKNFFSPKLYLKESYFRRKEDAYMKRLLATSGIMLIAAGATMFNSYTHIFFH